VSVYTVTYEQDGGGNWNASIKAVHGCHTYGATILEARDRIREALALCVGDREAERAMLVSEVAEK